MKKYIISLDQGTTSSRCIVFHNEHNIIFLKQKEFSQVYPKASWWNMILKKYILLS